MLIKLSELVSSSTSIPAKEGQEEVKSPLSVLLETKMPIKTSYWLKRFVDKIQPILKTYDEKRNDLIKEYGEEDKSVMVNGEGQFSVKDPEKIKLFFEKLNELLETEEEVEFTPFKLEDFGNSEIEPKNLPVYLIEK